MADDFSNLKNYKETPFQVKKGRVKIKKTTGLKPKTRICFIITKNKNNSWIDDLHAQTQIDLMERIFN